MSKRIALVGGRGYTGSELLGHIARHPGMSLAFASSTSQAGESVSEACPGWKHSEDRFISLSVEDVAQHQADAWVLAVPNGVAAAWADAIQTVHPDSVVLDLSADHRFDARWAYGLPERFRDRIRSSKLIANPGCYATGGQLGLLPVNDYLVGTPVIFGVSGYSGAGKTPSDKNNPDRLRDNLLPYCLSGHMHEKEMEYQLGRDVRFHPHVAEFFRGITLTLSVEVDHGATVDKLMRLYSGTYVDEPRIHVSEKIPEVQAARGTPDVTIGGFTVDERKPGRFSFVVTLDNLSKGAATQAIQNLNLALGFEEDTGIIHE